MRLIFGHGLWISSALSRNTKLYSFKCHNQSRALWHAFICPNKPWIVPKLIVNDGYSCKLSLGSIKSRITLPRFMEWTKMNILLKVLIHLLLHALSTNITKKSTSFQHSTRRRAALLQIFYMNYRYTRSRCHPFTSAAININFLIYNLLCILVKYSAL